MKNFWKNVFIFCAALLISVLIIPDLIIPDVVEEIRLVIILICVMIGGISIMMLLFSRVSKKGRRGEYQQLIAGKNKDCRF